MEGKILPMYVLAKEILPKEKTEKGIILAPTVKQPTIIGEVRLTGEGTKSEDMKIKVGDKILFSPNSFRRFVHPLDKEEYLLVHQKDVLLFAW